MQFSRFTTSAKRKTTRAKEKIFALVVFSFAATVLQSCDDGLSDLYASFAARFRFAPVTQSPPLRSALNNPGTYCRVTFPAKTYDFRSTDGQTYSVAATALDAILRPVCLNGFIIGTPNIPDANGNFYNVAYDLACSYCHHTDMIQRDLQVDASGLAHCPRCLSDYNLNNGGLPQSGPADRGLYRYRITYQSDIVLINN